MTKKSSNAAAKLVDAAKRLSEAVDRMQFQSPVTHVYNPLQYAWASHSRYLELVSDSTSVVFLGMNPGPWGMAQTGVPFGEIAAVRDWLGIHEPVGKPEHEHPKRPIEGFECAKSEVSGRRLWGLFTERFDRPRSFFRQHFVLNYCPLVFMEESARNRTPDKLTAQERHVLDEACDLHLQRVLGILQPVHAVGVGVYAEKCLKRVCDGRSDGIQIHRILHPSPASPAANKDWASKVTKQLIDAEVWPS